MPNKRMTLAERQAEMKNRKTGRTAWTPERRAKFAEQVKAAWRKRRASKRKSEAMATADNARGV